MISGWAFLAPPGNPAHATVGGGLLLGKVSMPATCLRLPQLNLVTADGEQAARPALRACPPAGPDTRPAAAGCPRSRSGRSLPRPLPAAPNARLESLSGEPKRLSRGGGSASGIFGTCSGASTPARRFSSFVRHAGAGATGVVQPSVFGVVAQQQGADVRPASLGIGPANDHELLAVEALRLDPDPAVARCVGSIGALGDGAFQAQLAGLLAEARTVASNVLAVAQPVDLLLEQALAAAPCARSAAVAPCSCPFRNRRSKAKNTS